MDSKVEPAMAWDPLNNLNQAMKLLDAHAKDDSLMFPVWSLSRGKFGSNPRTAFTCCVYWVPKDCQEGECLPSVEAVADSAPKAVCLAVLMSWYAATGSLTASGDHFTGVGI